MVPTLIKKTMHMSIGIMIAWPITSAMAWQGFLVLFSPPPVIVDVPAEIHAVEIATRVNCPNELSDRIDDAGCDCDPSDMVSIEFRVQSDDVNFIGHAYLKTPRLALGFCTDARDHGLVDYLWPFSETSSGHLRNDFDHGYDYVSTFRVCPLTNRRLEISIVRHADDPYQVGGWRGGRNCATWAADRLREAGLPPPQGDCPNKMAWSMQRVDPNGPLDAQVAQTRQQGDR